MTGKHVPQIFSAARRAARARKIAAYANTGDGANWLFEQMEEDCMDRLAFMHFEPSDAVIIGPTTGSLANRLEERGTSVNLLSTQDEERPAPWPKADLIVSLNRLDTVNDLPGALLHYRGALREGGLMIGQLVGAGSLPVLRKILLAADRERPAARIHPQIDNRAATGLLQRAGFSRQVVDQYPLTVKYRELDTLFADLRAQGLTNVLADPPPPLTRGALDRARAAFDDLRDDDGKVAETFEVLTLTGWR